MSAYQPNAQYSGSPSVGNLATWGAPGVLMDGGPVPSGVISLIGPVATIAALRAATTATLPQMDCFLRGYYATADGGEGMLCYEPGDTTSADNGVTIYVDTSGRRWYRLTDGRPLNLRCAGAKGDGITDDTAAIQAWVNAGDDLYAPIGQFVVSSTIQITKPLKMVGGGAGIGPGVTTDTNCTQFLCTAAFTTGDVFSATTYYSCIFRDFQIAGKTGLGSASPCPRTSGAGIHISGPNPGTNECSQVIGMAFSGLFYGLQCTLCVDQTIERNYFQAWKDSGYLVDNASTTIECSAGHVVRNKFYGDPTVGGPQLFGLHAHDGYTNIADNLFEGSQIAIAISVDQHNIGNVFIKDNSIEDQTVGGIIVAQAGSYNISSIQITGNEFSNLTIPQITYHIQITGVTDADIFDVDISDNNFSSTMSGGAAACIDMQYGENVTICRNRFNIASCYAVICAATVGTNLIADNMVQGTPTGSGYFLASTNTVLKDPRPAYWTVALLPTTGVTNGSSVYVTDGHATSVTGFNYVVTGSGSGCQATLMRGQWLTFVS